MANLFTYMYRLMSQYLKPRLFQKVQNVYFVFMDRMYEPPTPQQNKTEGREVQIELIFKNQLLTILSELATWVRVKERGRD